MANSVLLSPSSVNSWEINQNDRQNVRFQSCDFHPTGLKLVCGLKYGPICIFRRDQPTESFSNWTKIEIEASGSAWVVAWNTAGDKVVAGLHTGTLVLVQENMECKSIGKIHNQGVSVLKWNPFVDEEELISGSWDGSICWYSVTRKTFGKFEGHERRVRDIVWLARDSFASCSYDKTVRIYAGDQLKFELQHNDKVYSLRWLRSSDKFASCSKDGCVKIWTTGGELRLNLARGSAYCIDWCSTVHGQVIARGHYDNELIIWNAENGGIHKQLLDNKTENPDPKNWVRDVSFSPDGRFLASIDRKGKLFVWHVQDWTVRYKEDLNAAPIFNSLKWSRDSGKLAVANKFQVFMVGIQQLSDPAA